MAQRHTATATKVACAAHAQQSGQEESKSQPRRRTSIDDRDSGTILVFPPPHTEPKILTSQETWLLFSALLALPVLPWFGVGDDQQQQQRQSPCLLECLIATKMRRTRREASIHSPRSVSRAMHLASGTMTCARTSAERASANQDLAPLSLSLFLYTNRVDEKEKHVFQYMQKDGELNAAMWRDRPPARALASNFLFLSLSLSLSMRNPHICACMRWRRRVRATLDALCRAKSLQYAFSLSLSLSLSLCVPLCNTLCSLVHPCIRRRSCAEPGRSRRPAAISPCSPRPLSLPLPFLASPP